MQEMFGDKQAKAGLVALLARIMRGILPPAAAAIFSAQRAGLGGLVESGGVLLPRANPAGSHPHSGIGLCCAPAHSCFLPRSSRTRTCAPPRGMGRPDPSILAPALPFAAAPAPALARAAAHASAPLARPRSRPGAASFEAFLERAHASTGLRTIVGGGRACCSACPRRRCCRRSRSRDFACRARLPLQPPAGHEGLESRPVRSRPDAQPKNMRRSAAGRRQRTGYRPLCFLIAGFRHGPHALGARPGGRPCGADSLAARTCGRAGLLRRPRPPPAGRGGLRPPLTAINMRQGPAASTLRRLAAQHPAPPSPAAARGSGQAPPSAPPRPPGRRHAARAWRLPPAVRHSGGITTQECYSAHEFAYNDAVSGKRLIFQP